MRDRRVIYIVLAVAALVALFLLLRPADDEGAADDDGNSVSISVGSGTQSTPELQPATNPEAAVRADIRLRGTRPIGGLQRINAQQGQTVIIFVRSSSVRDEVHVHVYDVKADVGPGDVARIVFTADQPGRFEIELEEAGQQIAQLNVSP